MLEMRTHPEQDYQFSPRPKVVSPNITEYSKDLKNTEIFSIE